MCGRLSLSVCLLVSSSLIVCPLETGTAFMLYSGLIVENHIVVHAQGSSTQHQEFYNSNFKFQMWLVVGLIPFSPEILCTRRHLEKGTSSLHTHRGSYILTTCWGELTKAPVKVLWICFLSQTSIIQHSLWMFVSNPTLPFSLPPLWAWRLLNHDAQRLPEHPASSQSVGSRHSLRGQHALLSHPSPYRGAHSQLFSRRDMAASEEESCGPFLCRINVAEKRIFCSLWLFIVF